MTAETFKRTFLPIHPKLYRIAFRIVENQEDAEDILQDVFVKLWEKRSEMKNVLNHEGFAVTVLKNTCLDFLKKHKAYQVSTNEVDVPEGDSLIEQFEYKNRMEILKVYIDRLPEQQRKIFQLYYRDDFSVKEIEEMTGLAAGNIKVILSRTRSNLKALNMKTSMI